MKSIVVPVNFSANSSNAARYAVDMAVIAAADVHLIYVLQPPVSMSEVAIPDYVFEEMQRSGQILLGSLKEELVRRGKDRVKVTMNMAVGGVEQKLEEFCEEQKPFVVVMGASGNSFENILSGSSTVRAMHRLPYPLLVIPEKAVYHPVKKIVVACDMDVFGDGIPVSLEFLKELKAVFLGSQFVVVNVATREEEREGEAVFKFDSWQERLKELFPEVHFVRADNIAEGIHQYLSDSDADWLMVFPKKHRFLDFHKSRSRRIVKGCGVPVISVHAI